MNTYIALLRGINVGGANRLPMSALKTLLERQGCADVRTYIQSGNVILTSPIASAATLATQITAAIRKSHGFEPHVLLLTPRELRNAASANPFTQADEHPQGLHLFFLDGAPRKADLHAIEALKTNTESFALKGNVFYLYAPDGVGRAQLAGRVERLLGVVATARNWNTVTRLLGMV
ncbi:MAG TPA: DUF1697 domain-containing protein [Vicinamibacterales bacterium]|nr:DUF1697 domain-containing protein [Vicinamibacterales bacterium]